MKSSFIICDAMNNFVVSVDCNTCGDYDRSSPCDVDVPDHIPDKQIKKFIMSKNTEKNNAKILF